MMLLTKIEPEAFFTVSEQTELFLLSVLAGVTAEKAPSARLL